MSPSKRNAILLMLVVFVLGVVVGASLATTMVSKKLASTERRSPRDFRQKMMEKFKSRLELNPEQTTKLQTILEEVHQQFEELHHSVKPQFDKIRDQMRSRINEILDENQKKEFQRMEREFEEREKGRGK